VLRLESNYFPDYLVNNMVYSNTAKIIPAAIKNTVINIINWTDAFSNKRHRSNSSNHFRLLPDFR